MVVLSDSVVPCSGRIARRHTAQVGEIAGRQYRSPQKSQCGCMDICIRSFGTGSSGSPVSNEKNIYDAQASLLVIPTFDQTIHDVTADPQSLVCVCADERREQPRGPLFPVGGCAGPRSRVDAPCSRLAAFPPDIAPMIGGARQTCTTPMVLAERITRR